MEQLTYNSQIYRFVRDNDLTPVPLENNASRLTLTRSAWWRRNPRASGLSHAGAIDGFQSFLLYFSDQDVAIAIVTNAFPAPAAGDPQLIAMVLAKAALPRTVTTPPHWIRSNTREADSWAKSLR